METTIDYSGLSFRPIALASPEPLTAAALGPAESIAAPEPGVPMQSLLRAARVIDHGPDDLRWVNGIGFSPEGCADATIYDPCVPGYQSGTRNRGAARSFLPFVVDAYDACSTFGWQAADYEGRARRLLARTESKAIAAELWTGTLFGSNPHLADNPNVTTVGTALAPRDGLSKVVQGIAAANGGVGMVHMRPRMLQVMVAHDLLRYEGGLWYTAMGQRVVADAGYPGTGPNAQAITATTEWIFGTDLVEVHRGPVEVFAAPNTAATVDHETNNEVVRAKRFASAIFNGCALVAASITVPTTE